MNCNEQLKRIGLCSKHKQLKSSHVFRRAERMLKITHIVDKRKQPPAQNWWRECNNLLIRGHLLTLRMMESELNVTKHQ
jgi:hypothetical protein